MLGWQELYLNISDRSSTHCAPNDIPTLAPTASLAVSAGDPVLVPSTSPLPTAAPQETSALEEPMPEAREAPVPQV
jgi:hypothetical protein